MSTPDPTTKRTRHRRAEQPPPQGELVETPPALPEPVAGTALTLPERARQAIGLLNIEAQLTGLASKTATITEITNADGRAQVHASAMALREQRIVIERAGSAARDDANRFAKEVIAQQDKLIALIEPEETRLKKLRDAWDKAREEEKRAKAEADRRRAQAIQQRIQDMRDRVAEAAGHSADQIEAAIREFTAILIDDSFAEFKEAAAAVHTNVLARLRSMHAERLKFEQDRAEAAEREAKRKAELDAEMDRQRKERALNEQRMEKIRAIHHQVIIATTGRKPDRKPGTRECLVETLAETERWPITEEEYGPLHSMAIGNRDAAVMQIKHLLERFDERVAERKRQDDAEQQRREAEERQRAEDERLAEERRKLQADREQLEVLQASLKPKDEPPPAAAPVAGAPAAEEFVPSRRDLVALVANEYAVADALSESWLVKRFGGAG
jgi:hypothetical protein